MKKQTREWWIDTIGYTSMGNMVLMGMFLIYTSTSVIEAGVIAGFVGIGGYIFYKGLKNKKVKQ